MVHARRFVRTTRIGNWLDLGQNNIVRVIDFEDLAWELDGSLLDYNIAYCRSGGPIALHRRNVGSSSCSDSVVKLYNSNGTPHPITSQLYLDGMTGVVFMCWNDSNDNLIVVSGTGAIRFFNFRGEPVDPSLRVGVPSVCTSTGNGVALLVGLREFQIVLVECQKSGEYKQTSMKLPLAFDFKGPNVILAIPSKFTVSERTEVLVPFPTGEGTSSMYHFVFNGKYVCHDLGLYIEGGDFVDMVLSPNGQNIAFMVRDGTVYVASSRFDDITRLLNINTEVTPSQLLWCGDKCLCYLHTSTQFDAALEFPTTLTIVNVEDPETVNYVNDFASDVYLVTDCDGLRILSRNSYHFLQVVPAPCQRIFALGSRASSAMLLLAFDEFMCGNPTSVGIVRDLQRSVHDLFEAVDDCIHAAGFELSVPQQKRMLRVAAFGKSFCPMYDPDASVSVARRLRALNAFYKSKAGMVMSLAQLSELNEQIIQRLIMFNFHQLAFHVCDMLGLSTNSLMTDWAVLKLTDSSVSQEKEKEVAEGVVQKLRQCNQSNFCMIARKVYEKQKPDAALILLQAEKLASKQVVTLLEIGQFEVALRQAVRSGDADLIFTTLMALVNSRGTEAISILGKYPISRKLLFVYAKACFNCDTGVMDCLRAYHSDYAYLVLLRYFSEEETSVRLHGTISKDWDVLRNHKLELVRSALASQKHDAAKSSSKGNVMTNTFSSAILPGGVSASLSNEEWLQLHMILLEEQRKLFKRFSDKRFLSASVTKTITLCYAHGCKDVADRIKGDFGVSEKMNTWCMLKAFASNGQWDLIDQLSDVKGKTKPAIGGFAFVKTLLDGGQMQQAKLYIPKIPQIEWRMEYYVLCGDWGRASADCCRNSEPEMLAQLKDRAKGDPEILQQIDAGWNSVQDSGTGRLARLFG